VESQVIFPYDRFHVEGEPELDVLADIQQWLDSAIPIEAGCSLLIYMVATVVDSIVNNSKL
jgi:hypothetical protein